MGELSQEAIDALLRGEEIDTGNDMSSGEIDLASYANEEPVNGYDLAAMETGTAMAAETGELDEVFEDISVYFSPVEVDALGEIGNICMGTSATTMSAILGHRVLITTPKVRLLRPENALAAYGCPFLAVSVGYVEGIFGKNLLILKDSDAMQITDLMMGGDGNVDTSETALTEIHLSAISEIMNQMVGSSATAMSNMLGIAVNISPPEAASIDINEDVSKFLDGSNLLIRISFDMEIEGVLNSKLLQLMPIELAKELVNTQLYGKTAELLPTPEAPVSAPIPTPMSTPAPAPITTPAPPPAAAPASPIPSSVVKRESEQREMVSVKQAEYPSFEEGPHGKSASMLVDAGNLGLISDIPLQVTVELGRTTKSLQDVMGFGTGSIVVLDRLAGEPVDIIVNGKRIAKGEVVVIDENYGIRINEIFSNLKIEIT